MTEIPIAIPRFHLFTHGPHETRICYPIVRMLLNSGYHPVFATMEYISDHAARGDFRLIYTDHDYFISIRCVINGHLSWKTAEVWEDAASCCGKTLGTLPEKIDLAQYVHVAEFENAVTYDPKNKE